MWTSRLGEEIDMGKVHVLQVGLDDTIFTQEGRGDLAERLKEYGKFFRVSQICFTKNKTFKPLRLSDSVMVYPSNSWSSLTFPSDAVKIARKIAREKPVVGSGLLDDPSDYHDSDKKQGFGVFDLVAVQDPFLCGWIGSAVKREHNVPLLVNVFSSFIDNVYWFKQARYNKLLNRYGKWLLVHRADGVRCECKSEAEYMKKIGVNADKMVLRLSLWT